MIARVSSLMLFAALLAAQTPVISGPRTFTGSVGVGVNGAVIYATDI